MSIEDEIAEEEKKLEELQYKKKYMTIKKIKESIADSHVLLDDFMPIIEKLRENWQLICDEITTTDFDMQTQLVDDLNDLNTSFQKTFDLLNNLSSEYSRLFVSSKIFDAVGLGSSVDLLKGMQTEKTVAEKLAEMKRRRS